MCHTCFGGFFSSFFLRQGPTIQFRLVWTHFSPTSLKLSSILVPQRPKHVPGQDLGDPQGHSQEPQKRIKWSKAGKRTSRDHAWFHVKPETYLGTQTSFSALELKTQQAQTHPTNTNTSKSPPPGNLHILNNLPTAELRLSPARTRYSQGFPLSVKKAWMGTSGGKVSCITYPFPLFKESPAWPVLYQSWLP